MPLDRTPDISNRELTRNQERCLDRIDSRDPAAKVIGWDGHWHGPEVRLTSGEIVTVRMSGYPRPFTIAK